MLWIMIKECITWLLDFFSYLLDIWHEKKGGNNEYFNVFLLLFFVEISHKYLVEQALKLDTTKKKAVWKNSIFDR